MKVVVSSWGCEYPQMPGVRTNAWSNVWPGIGTQVQGCTSPRRASCLSSSPRTWARLCEPGQPCPRSHERVNARISGVNAHLQWLACELHATPGTVVPNTHRLSRNTPISTFSPKRSAIWVPHRPEPRTHRPEPRPHRHQMGGNCAIRGATRRRHGERRLQMLQTPTITAGVRLPRGCKAPH